MPSSLRARSSIASLPVLRSRTSASSGLRRWRRAPLSRATWREFGTFITALRRTRYPAILDLQEQVKGALIARIARGESHGFDRASIREPLATLGDSVHHRVPRNLHFVARCRRLAG
ncbi:MAG: glycosyltransferase family 9 protein, partial [Betaproteobacteria bacterium]